MSNKHLTETKFDQLGLSTELLKALNENNFVFCTPIQEKTLPLTLIGKDVSGQAQTGTGKTISFLLALLTRLQTQPAKQENKLRAIVIAPTRELAHQIYEDALKLNTHLNFRVGLAYGGKDYQQQREIIESGIDILIGTPGRVIDYFKQKVYTLDAIDVLVLDEADRMFDLGFIKDIRFLLNRMPPANERLSMLFSATFTFRVHELAYEHMNNPESIKIEGEKITAEKIKESVYYPSMEEKLPLLIYLLRQLEGSRALVFVNTKHIGDRIQRTLKANDFKAGILSGDIQQSKREKLLDAFKQGQTQVLVATDVAARGLHIPDVGHVFNYDLPQDREDYVHRVGRTARAGSEGAAVSFACEQYAMGLPDIEEYIEHKLPYLSVPHESLSEFKKPAAKTERDKVKTRTTRKKPVKNDDSANITAKSKRPRKSAKQFQVSLEPLPDENIALNIQATENGTENHHAENTRMAASDNLKEKPINENLEKLAKSVISIPTIERRFSKRGYEIPVLG